MTVNQMIKALLGLVNTRDVSDWENEFIQSIDARTNHGATTDRLTSKQVEKIEQTYRKHFSSHARHLK